MIGMICHFSQAISHMIFAYFLSIHFCANYNKLLRAFYNNLQELLAKKTSLEEELTRLENENGRLRDQLVDEQRRMGGNSQLARVGVIFSRKLNYHRLKSFNNKKSF
jgi:hypothetical protein